jgi:hypothetical protein
VLLLKVLRWCKDLAKWALILKELWRRKIELIRLEERSMREVARSGLAANSRRCGLANTG